LEQVVFDDLTVICVKGKCEYLHSNIVF